MLFLFFFSLSCAIVSHAVAEQKGSEKALREYYDLQEGQRLYEQYCRFCHGPEGKGKAFNVTPPPADLTSPAVQKKSDADLTQTIHEGERGTAMGVLEMGAIRKGQNKTSYSISDGWLDDQKHY
ncbi:MAG: cytochrome c [Nitrospira sp.]|nr:cytochrome c [Nitrospira sp.]